MTIGSSRWDDIVDSMAYAEQLITPYSGDMNNQDSEITAVENNEAHSYGY